MKYKILYIDDEEANLRTFHSVFRRDYQILTALSGKEALEILDMEDPDILITDQYMPEMSGIELLKKVFEKSPKSKRPTRIMLSGYAESKDVKVAREKYGLKEFISKPWDSDKMKITLEESIREN